MNENILDEVIIQIKNGSINLAHLGIAIIGFVGIIFVLFNALKALKENHPYLYIILSACLFLFALALIAHVIKPFLK